jgi:hypothetical protein
MKLLTPPSRSFDLVEINELSPRGKIKRFLGLTPNPDKDVVESYSFVGKTTNTNVTILSESDTLVLGEKIPTLNLGSYKLFGVIPVVASGNEYECVVDYFEEINQE